jgi:hypothetical protein
VLFKQTLTGGSLGLDVKSGNSLLSRMLSVYDNLSIRSKTMGVIIIVVFPIGCILLGILLAATTDWMLQ